MRIHTKLLITFSVIALLAGMVAVYSLNATSQIVKTFEGGEEHFQAIIKAATELSSHTKRSESHLLLYITLKNPADRQQFFLWNKSLEDQLQILDKMVMAKDARTILLRIKEGATQFILAGEDLLMAYDNSVSANGVFDPIKHTRHIRKFYNLSNSVISNATELANFETDFLNKQFAISSASTINHLAKITESQLMLYMTLSDRRDLEKYLVGLRTLENTVNELEERLKEPAARGIVGRIDSEVKLFGKAGGQLFEAFHATQERTGRLDLMTYEEPIREFQKHSSNIRELGVELSNIMTDQEHRKKEEAKQIAASIERGVFIFVIVGGILTILLGYLLSATVAKPIVKLKEAALQIGQGKLNAIVEVASGGELGDLADTFRKMARALQVAHDELLSAKEYTDNILRSMSETLFVISPQGTIQTANPAACQLLGYKVEELIGQPFECLFHETPPFSFNPHDLHLSVLSAPVITPYRTKEGLPIYVSFSSSLLSDASGLPLGIVCVAQDMTERRKSLKELRLLATVVEQAAEAILLCTPEGGIHYVNPAFVSMTGLSRPDVIGKEVEALKMGKDNREFFSHLSLAMQRKSLWNGHFLNTRKDGSSYDEECTIFPVYDEQREIINFVAFRKDVTRERRLERQLQQSQKHQALGTLAGGIAHDFNNILSAIIAYVEGSLPELPETNQVRINLQEVLRACSRAADLVNQILTFSRPTMQERSIVLLQPIIKGALKLMRGTMPSSIEIVQDISQDCGTVQADSTQIHQVLINLCTNAYHAMREHGGTLMVSLREISVEPKVSSSANHLELAQGRYAKMTVSDTGCGMSTDIAERIFEPYFTTKRPGEGTGLGLSMVHGIVESHHGRILVRSEPEKGSTFDIYLPILLGEEEAPAPKTQALLPPLRGRILFVDDEKIIAQSMAIVLKQIGCDVETFTNSVKALEVFRKNPMAFDMVITDQTMPRLSGVDIAREMLKLRPDLPIILTTGYTDTVNAEQAKEIGIKEFIMKPMVIDDLKILVGKYLHHLPPVAPSETA